MKKYTVHYETENGDCGVYECVTNSAESASDAFYYDMVCGEGEDGKDRTDIWQKHITEE